MSANNNQNIGWPDNLPGQPTVPQRSNKERNRKTKMRDRAAKNMPHLLKKTNGRCHWCNCQLVRARDYAGKIIKRTGSCIYWRGRNHEIVQCKFATVDHLQRLADGGGNSIDNLVAACSTCNNMRDRLDEESMANYLQRVSRHYRFGNEEQGTGGGNEVGTRSLRQT